MWNDILLMIIAIVVFHLGIGLGILGEYINKKHEERNPQEYTYHYLVVKRPKKY